MADESGAVLYHSLGCVACHDPIDGYHPPWVDPNIEMPSIKKFGPTISTARFKSEFELSNYLQNPPPSKMLNMGLSASEARSIAQYLYPRFKDQPSIKRAAIDQNNPDLDVRLTVLGCLNCHTRNRKGGPDSGRLIYFTTTSPIDLGEEGKIPPSLTGVGKKLKPGALKRIINGRGSVRPYMATRMPRYSEKQAAWLADALIEKDDGMKVKEGDIFFHGRNMYGRKLMGTDGKGCITCHNLNGKRSLGIPALDLATTHERLQPQWFQDYLLNPQSLRPGTRMPSLFESIRKATGRKASTPYPDIAHIWNYLKEIDQSPLPSGMADQQSFKLVPEDRPIVFRTFMHFAGMEAIAVGFPEGIHAAFDVTNCRWSIIWKGPFLDAESTWIDRFNPPAKPLGHAVKELHLPAPSNAEFMGYTIDDFGTPTFMYNRMGKSIRDTLRPIGVDRFERTTDSSHAITREVIRW